MFKSNYLMEHETEAFRLDIKTDVNVIARHARWAGLKPGMKVADMGCGPGAITHVLHELVQPHGSATGIDCSEERISYARHKYGTNGVSFIEKNLYEPLDILGKFDFVWMRFVLEYHREKSFELVKNMKDILNPGGTLCLIDLDNNCLNHYGLPKRLERTVKAIIRQLEEHKDFDPYIGRKLYSFLYKLNFENINVMMEPHHLIFGEFNTIDAFDWHQKLQVAVKKLKFDFSRFYKHGYEEFCAECEKALANPGRFTYTPVIICKGVKEK